jgi:hypothetical protein
MSRIRVTIDRLVLRGFEPADRAALVESFRDELSHVLSDPQIAARLSAHRTRTVRLGRMPLGIGPSGSRSFGGGMARVVAKGLMQ